jgi:ribonuclease R
VFNTGSDTKKPRRNKTQEGRGGQKSEARGGGAGQGSGTRKKKKFYDNVPINKSTKRKKKKR